MTTENDAKTEMAASIIKGETIPFNFSKNHQTLGSYENIKTTEEFKISTPTAGLSKYNVNPFAGQIKDLAIGKRKSQNAVLPSSGNLKRM